MPPAAPSPNIPEREASELLLARALEESDRDGRLISPRERERAGLEARAEAGRSGEVAGLVDRARRLLGLARSRVRGIDALLAGARASVAAGWFVALALVVGLSTNVLGGRHVNVLAFPLLGALAWNVLVYAWLAAAWLRARARPREAPVLAGVAGPARRVAERLLRSRLVRLGASGSGEDAALAADAATRFAALWTAMARPLIAARVRRSLHLGACAFVAGLVAGMYLRGLAFEYRAHWESTFLGEEAARRLLSTVLGPASALSGLALPDLAAIRAPADGVAAPWIHLWAISSALFVLAPRAVLALADGARARSLAAALPLELSDPYWRRLLAASAGRGVHALVIPYGAPLEPRAADRLRALLHDLLGARAEVRTLEPVEYGAEADALALPDGEGCLAAVFALAQTPELEVHARWLVDLRARLPAGGRLLALVDGSTYAERLGPGAAARERLVERRRAWDRAAREADLEALHADLAQPVEADVLEAAAAALWTAPAREEGP